MIGCAAAPAEMRDDETCTWDLSWRLWNRWLHRLRRFGSPFSDIPTPASESFDNLGRDGSGERHPEENEGFVNGICES